MKTMTSDAIDAIETGDIYKNLLYARIDLDNISKQIIEKSLQEVVNDRMNFPFGMSYEHGQIYRKGMIAAYTHALEMLG